MRKAILSLLMLLSFILAGCVTSYNLEEEAMIEPNFVDSSETIAFSKIVIKIPYNNDVIFYHNRYNEDTVYKKEKWESTAFQGSSHFNEIGTNVLENYGYQIIEDTTDLFGNQSQVMARFQIAGIIKDINYHLYPGESGFLSDRDPASMTNIDIEFQVYDTFLEKVSYKKSFTGTSVNKKKFEDFDTMVYDAFKNTMLKLVDDKDFIKLVTETDTPSVFYEKSIPINYRVEGNNISLPQDIEGLFSSVITIKSGFTHGSGFFISDDGYILTAAHVVRGLDTVQVVTHDDKAYEAKVVRLINDIDAALLKIEKEESFDFLPLQKNLPTIGKNIFVIGTPVDRNFSYSVTQGIISGYRGEDNKTFIQIDAAINPGNSGGPLLDTEGKIIGVISSKIVRWDVEGIGFAVGIENILNRLNIEKNE